MKRGLSGHFSSFCARIRFRLLEGAGVWAGLSLHFSTLTTRPYNARMTREDGPEVDAGRRAAEGELARALREQGP
jgi:hypothetical protein